MHSHSCSPASYLHYIPAPSNRSKPDPVNTMAMQPNRAQRWSVSQQMEAGRKKNHEISSNVCIMLGYRWNLPLVGVQKVNAHVQSGCKNMSCWGGGLGKSAGGGERGSVYRKTWIIDFAGDVFFPQPSTTQTLKGWVRGAAAFSFPLALFFKLLFAVHSPQYTCMYN